MNFDRGVISYIYGLCDEKEGCSAQMFHMFLKSFAPYM